MLATPQRPGDRGHRDLRIGALLVLLYAVPGIVIWLAAWMSGGRPRADIWNWPGRAATAALKQQPLAPWVWAGATRVVNPILFYAAAALIVLLAAGAAIVLYSVVQGGIVAWSPNTFRRGRPVVSVTRRQLRSFHVRSPSPERMIVGRRGPTLIATRPGDSLVVIGQSGAGKTSGICVPIIQEWRGPVVAMGSLQHLVGSTAGIRKRRGVVEILASSGAGRTGTCTWSPVSGCDSMDVAIRRAGWMLPASPHGAPVNRGVPFTEAVTALLAVSLWSASRTGAGVGELLDWLRDPVCAPLRAAIERTWPADPRARGCLDSLDRMPAVDRAACCDAVRAALEDARGDYSARALGEFDSQGFLAGAASGEPTLYIPVPPDLRQPGAVALAALGAVLDDAFGTAARGPHLPSDRRLLVVLDGTASRAPVRGLAEYLAVGGDLGVTFLVTFRDLPDAEQGYGIGADDLIGSAQAVAVLGPQSDERTLRLLSDLTRRDQRHVGQPLHGSAHLLGPGQGILFVEALPPFPFWTQPSTSSERLTRLAGTNQSARGVGWVETVK
jgi:hypothetical protein